MHILYTYLCVCMYFLFLWKHFLYTCCVKYNGQRISRKYFFTQFFFFDDWVSQEITHSIYCPKQFCLKMVKVLAKNANTSTITWTRVKIRKIEQKKEIPMKYSLTKYILINKWRKVQLILQAAKFHIYSICQDQICFMWERNQKNLLGKAFINIFYNRQPIWLVNYWRFTRNG